MKHKLIIPVLLLMFFSAHSQESKDYLKNKDKWNYRKGYIINRDSVKIAGLLKQFSDLNDIKRYFEVVFIPKDGSKISYNPRDIKAYGYSIYTFVSFSDSFYELVNKGSKVELYKKIVDVTHVGYGNPGALTYRNSNEVFFVRKPSEPKLTEVKKRKFDEVFSLYFEDCPVVGSKILHKEMTEKDIEKIVKEYNWCK